jgi:hypothetical protein
VGGEKGRRKELGRKCGGERERERERETHQHGLWERLACQVLELAVLSLSLASAG